MNSLWNWLVSSIFAIAISTSISFVPGSPTAAQSGLTASPNTLVADGATTTTLAVTARDAYGNVVPNVVIMLAASGGNNVFGAVSGTTDVNGVFHTTLASTLAQSETVNASVGGAFNLPVTIHFVVGAANATKSTWIVTPGSQVANNSNTIGATLTLLDAFNNPITGQTATFSADGVSTTLSATTATTSASGKASITYQSGLAQNENALVTAGGLSLTAPIAFVPGPPNATSSTLVANPTTLLADGVTTSALTLTARDAQSNTIQGVSVALAGSGGNNTFAATTGVTAANGVFTTTLKSIQPQTETLTATLNSSVTTTAAVTFTVGPASSSASTLVVSPSSQIADNSSLTTATLTLLDAQGHPLSGQSATFTASGTSTTVAGGANTDASGKSSATYRTGLAQNENARVTAGGLNLTTPMAFVPGPPNATMSTFVANPNTLAANGAATSTLTLTARDAQGNVAPNVTITLAASGGNNVFGAVSGTTDVNGVFHTTLASTLAQSETVNASVGGAFNLPASVQFVVGAASATKSTWIVTPGSQVANNSNTIGATLTLLDAFSNPITGQTATFSADGASTTLSATTATTSPSGQASMTYQSGLAQNENALVTAGGLSLTTPMAFVPGPPDATNSTLVANPNTLLADGVTTSALTLTARDAQGNAIPGVNVSLAGSGGSNIFAAATGVTAANGTFSTTLKSTQVQTETLTATLNGTVTTTATVTFTVGPASSSTSTLVVSPSSKIADNSNTTTATLTLTDAQGHPISGQSATFTASGTSTTVSGSTNTNASGKSSATYRSSLAQNENAQVSAGGINLVAPFSFIPGPPSSRNSYATVSPSSQPADGSSTITLTGRLADYYNNSIANQKVVFSVAGSAGPFAASTATSTGSGAFTNTIKSSSVGSNTLFATAVLNHLPISTTASFTSVTAFCTGKPNYTESPITVQNHTIGMAVGDLNGDSKLDLLVVNNANDTISVLLGTGSGTFQTPVAYNTGSGPWSLAVGDFNEDGKLDVVVVNKSANTVSILLGSGSGTLALYNTYSVGSTPEGVSVGDVDADGHQDLAVANTGGNVSILRGLGTGAFNTGTVYAAGGYPTFAVLADVNNDGMLDLAVGNYADDTISILLNTRSGTFSSAVNYSVGLSPSYNNFSSGDFNGDGNLDLVVPNYAAGTVSVLLNAGSGTFSTAVSYTVGTSPTSTAVADLNGDGIQDLVVATEYNSSTFLLGSGSGTFPTAYQLSTPNQYWAVTGDFNGDGKMDVAYSSLRLNYIMVLLYSACN